MGISPKGMNYFKVLYDCGQDPTRGDWVSWQMATSANPFLNRDEIEAARLDLTETAFNQEYLARFVDWEGSVFRRVLDAVADIQDAPQTGHEYIVGCDWGRSTDYTVFLVLDTTARAVVAVDRSRRVDYAVQCGRLLALRDLWRPQEIIAESNSIGQPVMEQLERDGIRVQPFLTTNASKAKAMDGLALAFERGDIRIPNDPVLVGELPAYQAERLPSGQMRYGAPAGQHDDCVMALATAWTAISSQQCAVYPSLSSGIVMPPFPIPDDWPRAYGVDLRGNQLAAVFGAYQPASGVLYLYDEYVAEGTPDEHLEAIIRRCQRCSETEGVIDPTANGREQRDGSGLIQIYRRTGMDWIAVNAPLESGIVAVSQCMGSGRLRVFNHLVNFMQQLRHYRRDDQGRVLAGDDALLDATRCLVTGALPRSQIERSRISSQLFDEGPIYRGPDSWMA